MTPNVKREFTPEEKEFLLNNEPLKNIKKTNQITAENSVCNGFVNENIPESQHFYIPPVFTKEALMLDQGVKVVTANIEELSIRLGKEIKKVKS